MTNEQLCLHAKNGDEAAIDALIKAMQPSLEGAARRLASESANLAPDIDDLIQEGAISLLRAIENYDPNTGVLFQTFSTTVYENAMLDFIRKLASEHRALGDVIHLEDLISSENSDEAATYYSVIPDDYSKQPDQILIKRESLEEIHHALSVISPRERTYLHYRFGFHDDQNHDQLEVAAHFHLSINRARNLERLALDNFSLELPWWY